MRITKITVLVIILIFLVTLIIILPGQRKKTEVPLPESAAPQTIDSPELPQNDQFPQN